MEAKFCSECGKPLHPELTADQAEMKGDGDQIREAESVVESFRAQAEKLLDTGFVQEAKTLYESGLKMLDSRKEEWDADDVAAWHATFLAGIAKTHQKLGDYQKAARLLQEGLDLLEGEEKTPSRMAKAEIFQLMGWNHFRTGLTHQAAICYYNGLQVLGPSSESLQKAMLFQGLGMLFRSLGNNEEAKFYLQNCRQMRSKLNNESGVASASVNLGVLYTQIGDYSTAENYYKEALHFYKKSHDVEGIAISLANIGYVKYEQGQLEEAQSFIQEGIANSETACSWIIPICYSYLARIAASRKDAAQIRRYLDQIEPDRGDELTQAKVLELEAMEAFYKENHEECFALFEKAVRAFLKIHSGFDESVCLLNYGTCLVEYAAARSPLDPNSRWTLQAVERIGDAMEGFRLLENEKYLQICYDLLQSMDARQAG